jgi:outer membrane protein TolC
MRASRGRRALVAACCALLLGRPAGVRAQSTPRVSIGDAVAAAQREWPGAADAVAQAAASAEAVSLARSAYLPRLDATWQLTRATRNSVFGAFFPQNMIPISGPVLGTDSFESAWGSAVGLLFSAEVFDFGRRAAHVTETRAAQRAAEARADGVRLDAGVRAADLFLTVAGTARMVAADAVAVSRLEQLLQAVGALVSADVRPGADRARVDADLAAARAKQYADVQAYETARIRLAVAMGRADASPEVDAALLESTAPGGLPEGAAPATAATVSELATHPRVRESAAIFAATTAARDGARLAYRPTILLNGALSARGSGARVDGTIDGGAGAWPDVPNWIAGLQVTFPLFDLGATRARVAQRTSQQAAAGAREKAVRDEVTGARREAAVMAEAARRIAGTVPARLEAARQSAAQARARYDAGLTGIADVVEAERVLAQAEADAALATLALWRARLATASAAGDLAPFLAEASAPGGTPAVK